MAELKAMVDEVVKNAGSALERDAAIALRRIEHAAKMMAARVRARHATSSSSCWRACWPRRPDAGQPEEPDSARVLLILPPGRRTVDHLR